MSCVEFFENIIFIIILKKVTQLLYIKVLEKILLFLLSHLYKVIQKPQILHKNFYFEILRIYRVIFQL